MSRRRTACRTCAHLRSAITIARADLGDARGKLARAQGRHPEQVDRYLADIETRKDSLTHAQAELDRHQAECTIIVTRTDHTPTVARRTLTEEEIRTIRQRLRTGETHTQIAADLNIARSTVSNYADDITPAARFTLDDQPWADRALCAQTDPEAFFPEKGHSTREAKATCAACPVRTQCLEYALDHSERFGIWGGLSEKERRKLIARRQGRATCARRGCEEPVTSPDPNARYCSQSCAAKGVLARRHGQGVA